MRNNGSPSQSHAYLYPSPSDGQLTLFGLEPGCSYTISIVNNLGARMTQDVIKANLCGETTLDLTQFTKGIYIIHIVSSTTSEAIKFIKR